MRAEQQDLDELMSRLSLVEAEWQDEKALATIAVIEKIPLKESYKDADVRALLDEDFNTGLLVSRLFLGLSKDDMEADLRSRLGPGKIGIRDYRRDPSAMIGALNDMDLPLVMSAAINRAPLWHDTLVERLRSGRGSAVKGQTRGRGMEDFVEEVIRRVVGDRFDARCDFTGQRGQFAKCDFAIPDKENPSILIEVKAFGATGSKMTDVLGDVEKIIRAKRPDTALVFFTDGTPWFQRKSDFRKLVDHQHQGEIKRIYTRSMTEQFEQDLRVLADEAGLDTEPQ